MILLIALNALVSIPTERLDDYLHCGFQAARDVGGEVQRYCSTTYSRSGVNQMWILKNSKELLDNLKSREFSKIDCIKTYDFSTLYTTIPHDKLKSRLFEIIDNCFLNKNGTRKYEFLF